MKLDAKTKKYGLWGGAAALGALIGWELFGKKKHAAAPPAHPDASSASPLPVHVQGPVAPAPAPAPAPAEEPIPDTPNYQSPSMPGVTFNVPGDAGAGWVDTPNDPGWHEEPG